MAEAIDIFFENLHNKSGQHRSMPVCLLAGRYLTYLGKGVGLKMDEKRMQVNEERLTRTFQRLVSIDSPSFGEREMADVLKAELRRLGFLAEEDEGGRAYKGTAGNVYGFRKGKLPGSPLLFAAHMDTVEPAKGKRAVIHEDGRITSDGTTVLGADCMSGTAALLEALWELEEEKALCRDLEVVFFIGEEKHLKGSAVFDFSRVRAEESFILDLTGPVGTAAYRAPTLVDFQIEVSGKASHAGFAPEKGVHAIAIAARAVAAMELGRVGEDMTVNIGGIEGGGGTTNIVPERCSLIGEIRSYSHEGALQQAKRIEELFRKEAEKAGGSSRMTFQVPVHAYHTPKEHSSVRRFSRACEKLGLSGRLVETFGGSDQSNLSLHGIPGLVLASAMEQVHSCEEYTQVSELLRLTKLLKLLMQDDFDVQGSELLVKWVLPKQEE